MGFNSILSKVFGNKAQRDTREFTPYVEQIKKAHEEISKLSNDELRAASARLQAEVKESASKEREEIKSLKSNIQDLELREREAIWAQVDKLEETIMDKMEEKLDEILPQAFAIMKETAFRFANNETVEVTATQFDRDLAVNHDFLKIEGDKAIYANHWVAGGNEITWDMVHYDVQLFGGVVLHKGKIAEMATGEGKTLVATLPVFLNAFTGNGVHVVTVNDYLSKRDSEWMGPLYMFHGLSVDCIDKYQPNSPERQRAYNCDITFGTNNEFGFDYLRDNMARTPADLVQRKHNYAIVDEVDSVLIDDARTPLIISGPVETSGDQMFEEYRSNVEMVVNAQRTLATKLLTEAKQKIASSDKKEQEEGYLLLYRSFKGLPKNKALIKFLSEEGIKANMLKTEEYYMQDNNRNMHIVTEPLYFVIDEKNNQIELTDKGIDLLTGKTDDPKFFVLPDITSQLSALENEDLSPEDKAAKKDELLAHYAIKSERVHTIHQLLKAYTLFEKDDQYVVMDNKVLIVDEQTGRIMDGRRYSDGLHQAIEAKEHVNVEAASQTKATITLQNYFRMYHKLAGMTGTAETEAKEFWDIYKLDVVVIPTNKPIARSDENDRIYKTARAKYAAVIEEIEKLIGEGRPVLVGTTSVEISELLSRMLTMRKIPHNVLNAKLHQKEAEIVAQAGQKGTVTIATNMAGRGTDIKLSPEVRDAGGLAIIGTERHESRRVDRQLRGRAGRQGDPGSSVFFVSLEDRLMRLFGSERISGMLDKLGFKEEDMLEGKSLSKSVENAQKKVEENNFGIRKHLLEYDDVKNAQRKVIYGRRNHALIGERIGLDVINTLAQCADLIAEEYVSKGDYEGFKNEVFTIFAMEVPVTEQEFKTMGSNQVADKLMDAATETLKRRMERIVAVADPVLQQFYHTQPAAQNLSQVYIPVTDGKLVYNIATNLKEAVESNSKTVPASFQKTIMLYTIDEAWEEHLRDMDELQNAVRNVSYENKDPLVIFKMEAYELFKDMVDRMNKKATSIIMRGQIPIQQESEEEQKKVAVQEKFDDPRLRNRGRNVEHKDRYEEEQEARYEAGKAAGPSEEKSQPYVAPQRIGRNDPCPCGSGKKYKNCHGKNL